MKKKILIENNIYKDFYQEIKKYTNNDIDEIQFIKDNVYNQMIEEVYMHYFSPLSDQSSIISYVAAGAEIYRELNKINEKLHIAYGGNLDDYLLDLIAGQFLYFFDKSEVLFYENRKSLKDKFKMELDKVSFEPYVVNENRAPYILLNSLIIHKGVKHSQLLERSGLSGEALAALRCGRKKYTKDIYYMIALAMDLSRKEFTKFADSLDEEFETERDILILSHMDNMLHFQRMPENKGKTSVEIINGVLVQNKMKPLTDKGRVKSKPSNIRTIFIPGGMGFIGQNCIKYFEERSRSKEDPFQYKICILSTSNINNENIPQNIIYYRGKLDDPLVYERILFENEVDYIIYLSSVPIPDYAKIDPGKTFDVNAQAFSTLCNTVFQNHIPIKGIIFPSTEHVYNGTSEPCKEDAVIDASKIKTTYACSKFVGESIASRYARDGLRIIIARMGNIYGEYDRHIEKRLIPKTIHLLTNDTSPDLYVDEETKKSAKLDFLYAGDLVRAFYLMFRNLDNEESFYDSNDIIYNVGSGNSYYVEEIQEIIMQIMDKKFPVNKIETPIPLKGIMNIEKIQNKLGFYPKAELEEGLRRTIEWYEKNIK